jgi:predicted O-methyltransferase YrrM
VRQYLEDLWNNKLEGKAWQIKDEFISLLSFIQDNGIKNILEIGAYKGGSALGFLEIGCNVTSIDIVKQPEIKDLEEKYTYNYRFFIREEKTSQIIEEISPTGGYDLLWIDGDHSYEWCMKDFNEFKRFVRQGGYVAFHDIVNSKLHEEQECEVWRAVDEIAKKYPTRLDFITDGTWGGISLIKL